MYRPEKVKGKTLKDVTPMRQRKFDELADIGLPLGTRVIVFDSRLYKDDVTTPSAQTRQPATVLRHYGEPLQHYSKDLHLGPYESLIDVQFDHDGRISKGHFTWGIELIHA
jgi:hypothetical protein